MRLEKAEAVAKSDGPSPPFCCFLVSFSPTSGKRMASSMLRREGRAMDAEGDAEMRALND